MSRLQTILTIEQTNLMRRQTVALAIAEPIEDKDERDENEKNSEYEFFDMVKEETD